MTARRDRLAEIIVEMHGPAATHNMPCAVCRDRHAVLDLTTGIMQPCWQCQDRGYRVRFSWWRWMRGGGRVLNESESTKGLEHHRTETHP